MHKMFLNKYFEENGRYKRIQIMIPTISNIYASI